MTRLALALAALALAALLYAGQAMAGEANIMAVEVIDGDTVRVGVGDNRVSVRLSGIDAPEREQDCGYHCGIESENALRKVIGDHSIECEIINQDKYGRLVATCRTADTTDLGEAMVRSGYAVRYPKYDQECRYCAAEAEAKAAHRGLWSGEFQMPWEWRKEHRR